MIWSLLRGILLILIFGISCNPKLEQPNVPISFSFRLDNDFDSLLFHQDLQNLKKLGIKNIGIELIVKNDSLHNPIFENIGLLKYVFHYLQNEHFHLHIIISKWNHESIKVPEHLLSYWNLSYQKLLANLLNDLKFYQSISSFTYGVDFQNIEQMSHSYQDFLMNLQNIYEFPILYSSLLNNTVSCSLHQFSNYIGIFYEHDPSDKHKKLARKLHPLISQNFKDKKIFITHSNIQGSDAKLQLQNLLRFWKNKNLSFININSIYNQTVISRDSVYFSLKKNEDFLNYIQEYCK